MKFSARAGYEDLLPILSSDSGNWSTLSMCRLYICCVEADGFLLNLMKPNVLTWKYPSAQGVHEVDPEAEVEVPTSHGRHCAAPSDALKVPGSQATH